MLCAVASHTWHALRDVALIEAAYRSAREGHIVQVVTGLSAYLYGIGYSQEKFMQELDAIVEHIKKSAQE